MQVSIGKLQAQTGTAVSTNTTLQEHAMQLKKMLNENSALINNHTVRIEAMEQTSVENKQFIQENIDSQLEQSKAVIRDHTTRIEHLEEASTDSSILIKNHTNVLLELDRRYNTTKGVIEAHSTALANLTQSTVDNNILFQNHTAKLSEIESVQVIKTAKIEELDKAIVDINIALLNYSYKFSEMGKSCLISSDQIRYSSMFSMILFLPNFRLGQTVSTGVRNAPNWVRTELVRRFVCFRLFHIICVHRNKPRQLPKPCKTSKTTGQKLSLPRNGLDKSA